ncbi:MAG: SDR family oxidoreductase [Acidobacteria bacterium]|nr:SDR family oxidoreductase [Acidobacteriota bacterium]
MLLLTGGTGLVGSELLPLLGAGPVTVLSRRSGNRPALRGDLAEPCLGLDAATYAELQASVTVIIHCAADTRFGLSLEDARRANVLTTRNLLEFARGCRRLEKFAHLSTVYVCGLRTGQIAAAPAQPGLFSNTYQQSKYEAEQLVIAAMSELPAAILRLSSIIGDSQSGRVRQFNYVHQLLRLLPRNVLPVAPCEPDAPVDLIPTDWAAAALASLIQEQFVPGRIYQVCAGARAALTVRQMIDWTAELMGPVPLPRLVPLEEYEEYVEKTRRGSDRLLNELLRTLGYFLPHLGLYQAFCVTECGIPLPGIRSYYAKVVDYCVKTNWGRA